MTYAVRPLHITRTALLSLLLAIALAPRSFAQTPPAPQYYRVQTIKLNSGMRPDWEKFYQAEILPALKKVGVKQHSVWRVAQGDLRQYFIITPINSLAELDEPSPLLKALGQEAGQALMTKQSRFFGEWRQDIVVGRPDLGIALTPNSPLKLAVLDTETVAPGHTADYEKWVKENILPVVKKTNAKGVLTGKTALGSDPNEYHVLVLFDSYAEIEKFVTTSAKAAAELKERVHQRCKEQLGEVAGIRRSGSAALDLAFTAAGRYDAYWERNLKPWDLAAGIVLMREAGGFVSDLEGSDKMLESGDVLAANSTISKLVLPLVSPKA